MTTNTYAVRHMETKNRIENVSQQKLARVAGLLYLTIFIAGIFAEFIVRQGLIVPGDAGATAANIMASEMLFRANIAADMVMIIADIALALVFYVLFKPVSKSLSMLAAFFRLMQAATLAVNLLNLVFALQLIDGASYLSVLGAEQQNALALLFLNVHGIGYTIGLTFFGVNLLILGFLVFKSGFFPKILGILLVAAAIGYLIDSFAKVLMPNYGEYAAIFDTVVFMPAFIAELALTLWLLVKGVKVQESENNLHMDSTQVQEASI